MTRNTTAPRPPRSLRLLLVGVAASIVLLVALPVAMLADLDGLRTAIRNDTDAEISPKWLEWALIASLIYTVVLHLVDVVLLIWLTPRVLRGRQWARITLTAYLVIATYFSLYSASKGGMFLWAVIPTDILHVIMIGLLWIPPSTRRFFTARQSGFQRSPSR
ncbi:hypothetical protein GCM10009689_26690 [Brevibacterium antiquum]|uniref:hypothetical protein n=1 Tax=Brevibacterium antiquum TaxID=234835 RepID=UPI0018DFD4A2|nr:hypothetical protein [Brevibacterium antiquum]